MGNVYFKSDLNHRHLSGTEYMRTEHKTLPSDPGTVGETLEAVGFSATKEKMDQPNATRATSSGVSFSFFYIEKY